MCTFSQFSEMNFTQGIDFLPPADWLCGKPSHAKVGELICLLRLHSPSSLTSQVDLINYQLAVQDVQTNFHAKRRRSGEVLQNSSFSSFYPHIRRQKCRSFCHLSKPWRQKQNRIFCRQADCKRGGGVDPSGPDRKQM